MPKIEELFAFVGCDAAGDEGVLAMNQGGVWMPMVGADMARVESLKPVADAIAKATNRPYKILKFKLVEMIEGDGP